MNDFEARCASANEPWTLVIFTRWPEPGRTKTRLIPRYGTEGAARIHRALLAHTISAAAALPPHAQVVVALADAPQDASTASWLERGWAVVPQQGVDLGDRMGHAVELAFRRQPSVQRVVLAGVDCPDYSAALFVEAAERLTTDDCVFAPTEDGGYGLVGVRRSAWDCAFRAALFSEIAWGSDSVMATTLARLRPTSAAHDRRPSYSLLKTIWDVDTPFDVERALNGGWLTLDSH